jgi:isopentenyl phosphate kinase
MKRRHRFQGGASRGVMSRIIMKWGGGLISDKSSLCKPYTDRISVLAECVKQLVGQGHDVIIVHGAGSFGHIRARQFRLAEGEIAGLEQMEAIDLVRSDMDTLHQLVISPLQSLPISSHAPRNFVLNTGPSFIGELSGFLDPGIHITFGDVVDCEPPKQFGVLSGDDLMLRLSLELPDVTHVIFAMGETAGLMTLPGPDGKLIPIWNRNMGFTGSHSEEIDVTGGIFLKAERASEISKHVEHVWFIDGTYTERIHEIIQTGHTIGTRIVNE